jgi:hypothetical protein
MKTHRGKIIYDYIKQEGYKQSALAKKIKFGGKVRTYRTFINKLADPNLPLDDILSFSELLNHNFFADIPEFSDKLFYKTKPAISLEPTISLSGL